MEESQPKKKHHSPFYTVLILFEVLFLLGLGIGFYTFFVPNNPISGWWKARTSSASPSEAKELMDKVGKLVLLPTGEAPTVATVSDKTKLQSQSFFARAENGDKVLIFTNAKKAYLYRPSINKVVEVSPIDFAPVAAQPTAVPAEVAPAASASAAPIGITIYNGSKITGLTAAVEKVIKEKAPNISVVSRGTTNLSYTKNLVIDVSGTNKNAAAALAAIIGGEVSTLPQGEVTPKTPLLVILGK